MASAHRTPEAVASFALSARENGYEVILAAAGKAAPPGGRHRRAHHAAGRRHSGQVLLHGRAGLPAFHRADAHRHPVATVAVGGGDNAAYLCAQILSIKYPQIAEKLSAHRAKMAEGIAKDDAAVGGAGQGAMSGKEQNMADIRNPATAWRNTAASSASTTPRAS